MWHGAVGGEPARRAGGCTERAPDHSEIERRHYTGLDGLNQPPDVTPSEELRLNMKVPPCEPGSCGSYSDLGVIGGDNAGFPNGRRLSDDILDASLQVVEGELVGNPNDLGDGVNANDVPFNETFPYVAYPHPGSAADPHS